MGLAPPLVGVAVIVILVPLQTLFVDAAMETAGTTKALILIVTLLLVAVVGLAQGALLVITQVTAFPFTKLVDV